MQLALLGIAFDEVRAFYIRALELLDPQTALRLVGTRCTRIISGMRDTGRFVHMVQLRGGSHGAIDVPTAQWFAYQSSTGAQLLTAWIRQLEEFAHKAIEDAIHRQHCRLATMAGIGIRYADLRKSSVVLVPDFGHGIPIDISDVEKVLNPIYESIKNACEDAARTPKEAVVIGCIKQLGAVAAHAMTIVHKQELSGSTAPLAHAPIFYLKGCATEAAKARMQDALLAAIRAMGPVFDQMKGDVRTMEAEATAIDCLSGVALASYAVGFQVSADEAVQMMLAVARKEIAVREYHDNQNLKTILTKIAFLIPFEIAVEKTAHRLAQFSLRTQWSPD